MTGSFLIGLLNPLLAGLCAIAFLSFWKGWRQLHAAAFAVAYLAYGLAFLLQSFPLFDDPIDALIANVLMTSVFFLFSFGLRQRMGMRAPFRALGIVTTLGFSVLLWFMTVDRDMTGRILAVNFMYGAMLLVIAWEMGRLELRKLTDRVLLGALVTTACYSFVRTITMLLVDGHIVDRAHYVASRTALILNFSSAFFSLVIAVALIYCTVSDMIEELQETSRVDPLSGLLNRRGFEEKTNEMLARHLGSVLPITFIICDLDFFKSINDRFGHAGGDKVIAAVGAVLSQAAKGGVAGRLGGEEFAIALSETTVSSGRLLAEAIRTALATLTIPGLPPERIVTASFGVAEMRTGDDLESALRRADMALFEAKRNGRDCVRTSEMAQAMAWPQTATG